MVEYNEDFLNESLSRLLMSNNVDTSDAKFCLIKEHFGKKFITMIPPNGTNYVPTYTKLELAMKIKKLNEKIDLHDFSFEKLVDILIRLTRLTRK